MADNPVPLSSNSDSNNSSSFFFYCDWLQEICLRQQKYIFSTLVDDNHSSCKRAMIEQGARGGSYRCCHGITVGFGQRNVSPTHSQDIDTQSQLSTPHPLIQQMSDPENMNDQEIRIQHDIDDGNNRSENNDQGDIYSDQLENEIENLFQAYSIVHNYDSQVQENADFNPTSPNLHRHSTQNDDQVQNNGRQNDRYVNDERNTEGIESYHDNDLSELNAVNPSNTQTPENNSNDISELNNLSGDDLQNLELSRGDQSTVSELLTDHNLRENIQSLGLDSGDVLSSTNDMSENSAGFTCPVCLEEYPQCSPYNSPPFLHTICQSCTGQILERYFSEDAEELICPICRRRFDLKMFVDVVLDNISKSRRLGVDS